MTKLFNEDFVNLTPDKRAQGGQTGFLENIASSFRAEQIVDTEIGRTIAYERAKEERDRLIVERDGGERSLDEILAPFMEEDHDYYELNMERFAGPEAGTVLGKAMPGKRTFNNREEAALKAYLDTLSDADKEGVFVGESFEARMQEIALEQYFENADKAARANTWGTLGQVGGSIGGQFVTPVNMASVFAGPAAGARIGAAMLASGAIGGVATAAQQPIVMQWRDELGLPSGFGQVTGNVLSGAVGGALFEGGVRGVMKGLRKAGVLSEPDPIPPSREKGWWDKHPPSEREALEAFDTLSTNQQLTLVDKATMRFGRLTRAEKVDRLEIQADKDLMDRNPIIPKSEKLRDRINADNEHRARAAAVAKSISEGKPLPKFEADASDANLRNSLKDQPEVAARMDDAEARIYELEQEAAFGGTKRKGWDAEMKAAEKDLMEAVGAAKNLGRDVTDLEGARTAAAVNRQGRVEYQPFDDYAKLDTPEHKEIVDGQLNRLRNRLNEVEGDDDGRSYLVSRKNMKGEDQDVTLTTRQALDEIDADEASFTELTKCR